MEKTTRSGVLGALGNRDTPLGAIALALDETGWLPASTTRLLTRIRTV